MKHSSRYTAFCILKIIAFNIKYLLSTVGTSASSAVPWIRGESHEQYLPDTQKKKRFHGIKNTIYHDLLLFLVCMKSYKVFKYQNNWK